MHGPLNVKNNVTKRTRNEVCDLLGHSAAYIGYSLETFRDNLSVLSQLDPGRTPTYHFLKIHLNIVLPSTPGSSRWDISVMFSHQIPVYADRLSRNVVKKSPLYAS